MSTTFITQTKTAQSLSPLEIWLAELAKAGIIIDPVDLRPNPKKKSINFSAIKDLLGLDLRVSLYLRGQLGKYIKTDLTNLSPRMVRGLIIPDLVANTVVHRVTPLYGCSTLQVSRRDDGIVLLTLPNFVLSTAKTHSEATKQGGFIMGSEVSSLPEEYVDLLSQNYNGGLTPQEVQDVTRHYAKAGGVAGGRSSKSAGGVNTKAA